MLLFAAGNQQAIEAVSYRVHSAIKFSEPRHANGGRGKGGTLGWCASATSTMATNSLDKAPVCNESVGKPRRRTKLAVQINELRFALAAVSPAPAAPNVSRVGGLNHGRLKAPSDAGLYLLGLDGTLMELASNGISSSYWLVP